jgi:hypothetical protein
LKPGGELVCTFSNFVNSKQHFLETADQYKRGDMLPIGHFYQDQDTVMLVSDPEQWEIINPNMIPEHRDLIVHLRKK